MDTRDTTQRGARDKDGVANSAAKVFISYSRQDRERALKIRDSLKTRAFDVFMDTEDILPAEEWKQRLGDLIVKADTVLFLLSPHSSQSEICAWEVAQAATLRKRIVPVVIETVNPREIPPLLGKLNFIFCTDQDQFASAMDSIDTALKTDLQWVRKHTQVMGLAHRWDVVGRPSRLLLRGRDIADAEGWRDQRPRYAPELTPVQLDFITVSRRTDIYRRRMWITGAFAIAVVTALLSFLAYFRSIEAENQRIVADNNAARQMLALSTASLGEKEWVEAAKLALAAWPRNGKSHVIPLPDVISNLSRIAPQLTERNRFGDPSRLVSINDIAFSPDGKLFATAETDGVTIWDTAKGTQITRLEGHELGVHALVFAPDGARLVTAADDGTARLWDIRSSSELFRFTGHVHWVRSIATSADGKRLATGSHDKSARIWDLQNGQEIARFKQHEFAVSSVALSPYGSHLATFESYPGTDKKTTAHLWDVDSGREILRLNLKEHEVDELAFSSDGRRLIGLNMEGRLQMWDVATGDTITPADPRFSDHALSGVIGNKRLSPDGRYIAYFEDKALHLRNLENRRVWTVVELPDSFSPVRELAISPDGRSIAAANGWGGMARIWEIDPDRAIVRLAGHEGWVNDVAFSPDGYHVATGSNDGSVRIWKVAGAYEGRKIDAKGGEVNAVAFAPDGQYLATGTEDGIARIWDATTGRKRAAFVGHGGAIYDVAISPDGRFLATASHDQTARLWDIEKESEITGFAGHVSYVAAVSFSPDGKILATGSYDGSVRLWDPATGEGLRHFHEIGTSILDVAFSPDGRYLATGDADGFVKLWAVESGMEMLEFEGHWGQVDSVVFSPDGTRLFTASWDITARIWDATSGAEIARFTRHSSAVQSVAVSPDGVRLAIGSQDAEVRLWDMTLIPIGDIFDVVCARLPDHDLTRLSAQYEIVGAEPICGEGYDPPSPH